MGRWLVVVLLFTLAVGAWLALPYSPPEILGIGLNQVIAIILAAAGLLAVLWARRPPRRRF